MDIEKMIETLRQHGVSCVRAYGRYCSICDEAATVLSTLQAENEKLRAEMERINAEKAKAIENLSNDLRTAYQSRDAAVEDMTEMIGDIEEIRHGYGVDNAATDIAFASLCGNYCANNGYCCYEESENYRCKHFKWRGMAKEA